MTFALIYNKRILAYQQSFITHFFYVNIFLIEIFIILFNLLCDKFLTYLTEITFILQDTQLTSTKTILHRILHMIITNLQIIQVKYFTFICLIIILKILRFFMQLDIFKDFILFYFDNKFLNECLLITYKSFIMLMQDLFYYA